MRVELITSIILGVLLAIGIFIDNFALTKLISKHDFEYKGHIISKKIFWIAFVIAMIIYLAFVITLIIL